MILYGITIVGSAFLLFLVQPIVAKQILPWFGGTASVWTVCVVFFQAVLLAGYAYAHALTRASPRTQTRVHVVLLAIGVAGLPIIASPAWKPVGDADPTWRIVGLLAATIGLPYFLLSSTGPLIQRWVATDAAIATPPARVYRLFALSNVGSLVGLLAYPFAIEPYTSLPVQSWAWSAGFVAFALACAACALRRRERPVVAATDAPDEPPAPRPTISRSAFWLVCGALGSMLLLAVTNHITQNIASMPFLWILPLTLYLLSFVVVFEGRQGRGWYVRDAWRAPVAAGVIAMAWAMGAHSGVLSLAVALPIFCAGLFLACVFCHGELAATRPAPAYLTQFYLCLSAGGALGGLFVALVAPKLFDNDWETPIAIVGLALLAVVPVLGRRERRPSDWLWGVPIGGVAAACVLLAGGGADVRRAARAPARRELRRADRRARRGRGRDLGRRRVASSPGRDRRRDADLHEPVRLSLLPLPVDGHAGRDAQLLRVATREGDGQRSRSTPRAAARRDPARGPVPKPRTSVASRRRTTAPPPASRSRCASCARTRSRSTSR